MKKLLTFAAAVLFTASMMASTVDDLVVISADYTFTPTAALTDATLYGDNHFLSVGGSGYNKGIQIKSNRQLAFKVATEATVTITFNTKSGRSIQLGSASAGTQYGTSETSPFAATVNAGIVYLSASSDLYVTEVKVTFVAADHTKATVKKITVDGEDLAGFDAAVLAYNVELPYAYEGLPTVAAVAGDDATLNINQVTELPGAATVVCKSFDESATLTYTINFTKKATGSNDATLSDLKVNGNTVTGFAAAVYEYNIEIGVYDAISVVATPNDDNASAAVDDATAGTVVVTVTAEDGATKLTYTINYTRAAATQLASISASTTWDWANAGSATAEQKGSTLPTNAEEFNFADVLINPAESFNAAALVGIAQFANRGTYFQGNKVKFNTTVPGTVVVTYSNTGGSRPYRHVKVNETMSAEGSANQDLKATEAIAVAAGDVEITFYIPDATQPQERSGDVVGPSMGRIYKIVFTKSEATAIDNAAVEAKATKRIVNGQLIIVRDGVEYNAQGFEVR